MTGEASAQTHPRCAERTCPGASTYLESHRQFTDSDRVLKALYDSRVRSFALDRWAICRKCDARALSRSTAWHEASVQHNSLEHSRKRGSCLLPNHVAGAGQDMIPRGRNNSSASCGSGHSLTRPFGPRRTMRRLRDRASDRSETGVHLPGRRLKMLLRRLRLWI